MEISPGDLEATMKTVHFRQRTGMNGALHLDVPLGVPNAECEVVVVVESRSAPSEWLPDFWARLSQGWQGAQLERPTQGACETRTPLQ
jgi:hypothetical protein